MSKIINSLTPEDFEKSFDMTAFSEWKKSVEEHEKAGIISMALLLIGLAILYLMPTTSFVIIVLSIGSFFVLAFTGIGITWPKMKKRMKCQRQLGISNSDLKNAIAAAKKRME